MRTKVEVTQQDIDEARRTKFNKNRDRLCPLARALRRTVGDDPTVRDTVFFSKGASVFEAEFTPKAARFVERFDKLDRPKDQPSEEDRPVCKPTTFTLNFEEQ
jgi:hypothetical protein